MALGANMRIKLIGLFIAAAALIAACAPASGSPEWCRGVLDGSVKPSAEEMVGNMDKCAAHELAG